MKMKLSLFLGIGLLGALWFSGCSKKVSPVAPIVPTGTPTPTATSTPTVTNTVGATSTPTSTTTPHATPTIPAAPPPGIFWADCEIEGDWNNSPNGYSYFSLSVNGAPEATCGVTLTTPSGDIPCSYSGSYGAYATYYATTLIPYQPGGTYTLTTVTSIGIATATLVAPGGSVTVSPDGLSASWNVEGNEDYVHVLGVPGWATYTFTSDIDSPYQIPSSAYPSAGTYGVLAIPQNTTYNITGAAAGSRFTIFEYYEGTVTK